MKTITSTQNGFAVIEAILIVIILAIVGGTGLFVYQSSKSSDETLNAAAKVAQSSPPKVTKKIVPTLKAQNYFVVKEWGVRAPYGGSDTLTYRFDNGLVTVISKQLAAANSGCATYGAGQIVRFAAQDDIGPTADSGVTAQHDFAQNPSRYAHVGNYYYSFRHDQAGCASQTTDVNLQNQANSVTAGLVVKFEAIQ